MDMVIRIMLVFTESSGLEGSFAPGIRHSVS